MAIRLVLAAAAALSLAPSIAAPVAPVAKGSPEILTDAAGIRAHMAFLADDLLEGREAGTRGDALAQLYIAARFSAARLTPAGDHGGYLQPFRVRGTQLDRDSVRFAVTGARGARTFRNGGDVALFGDPVETDQRIDAPVVFAGYGIVAPERGIDDYRGLEVRGKVVAVLGGPPAFLPPAEAAHYGSTDQQRLTAEAHGAIGVIHLWTPALEQRFAFAGLESLLGRTDLNWIGPDGRASVVAPGVRLRAFTRGAATEALLEGGARSWPELLAEARTRSPRGFALPARVSVARRSRHDDRLTTANVAALLEGSDPRLRGEVVVVSAHFDHVGIGEPVAGDAIYNGALDNAAGTAILLELAQRLAQAPERPRRSILFLAAAAEEKGLIGSDYFAAHPTPGAARIIADINIDGALPFYDFSDVIGFGAEQSQLAERLAAAAGQIGLAVAPDPFPEEGFFTRSDQYSFVRRGIPSLFLFTGFTDMSGRNVGRAVWDDATVRLVHQPSDDLSQPIDYPALAKFGEVARRLALEVANAPERPLWYRDSLFARFAPGAPTAERPAVRRR
ncbi:MAG TPA: M28 family metallopeptidase [Allosphingosinicella sp.]|nr:M28 family metallopeptidase [Allosphingosinicella sp.]